MYVVGLVPKIPRNGSSYPLSSHALNMNKAKRPKDISCWLTFYRISLSTILSADFVKFFPRSGNAFCNRYANFFEGNSLFDSSFVKHSREIIIASRISQIIYPEEVSRWGWSVVFEPVYRVYTAWRLESTLKFKMRERPRQVSWIKGSLSIW